ncbi:OLC1v1015750C1 [Oldenlandia corymbosa var. corymbosa]|uniref:OLC1v1015750C1 n=1 Tax=Oldenlandia corymbosa var. corymbosa TaxID=529605 RepID=A0AAV1E6U8_OLDCO|nr:OLC1v1015750C1 [Oldenlandia corymbosa var. corymbosa]
MTYRFRVSYNERSPFMRICCKFIEATRNWRGSSSAISREEGDQAPSPSDSLECKFPDKEVIASDGSKEGWDVCNVSKFKKANSVRRFYPILISCLIYGIIYSQSLTLYTKQGVTMDRSISPSLQVPAASLQSLLYLSILLFVAIYDRVLVPFARTITGKSSGITILQRIGVGLFVSTITMITAALVERKRLEITKQYGLADKPKETVPMSVVWLVPQYILFGVSEVFVMVGMQEFFCDEMPADLKSTGLALYLSIFGLGSFLSSFMISVIEKVTGRNGHDGWFSDNLNKGHLDYFYWLLAILSAVAFAAFLLAAKSYVYNGRHS